MAKLTIKGYRILVTADSIEQVTASGIVIVQDENLEKSKMQTGIVVGIGETCWSTDALGDAWCEVGDP